MTSTWRQKSMIMAGPTVAVGLVVGLAAVFFLPTPSARTLGYFAAIGLTVIALAFELVSGIGRVSLEKIRLCIPPLMLAISSATWLALVETTVGKVAIILAAFMLTSSYQSHLSSDSDTDAGFLDSRPGLPQAAFITDLFAVFFLTAFLFGVDEFYNIPMPLSAGLAGLLWGFVAHENLWRFGVKVKERRLLGLTYGLVGLEVNLGIIFLPISYLTGAAISAIILTVGLQLTRHIIFGLAETRKFRGQVIAVIALIIILLITAKWI